MPTDPDTLAERLRAVERALADGDPPATLAETAELATRVEELEAGLADLTERVLAVEAAVQSVQGYAGRIRHVNREIERRADAALAAVDSLENTRAPDDATDRPAGPSPRAVRDRTDDDRAQATGRPSGGDGGRDGRWADEDPSGEEPPSCSGR